MVGFSSMSLDDSGSTIDYQAHYRASQEPKTSVPDIFDRAAIGMVLLNENRQWIRVNDSACSLFGYSRQALISQTFRHVVHPDDWDFERLHLEEIFNQEKESHTREVRCLHKEGHEIWVRVDISVEKDEKGKCLYFVAQMQDVSQSKLIDRSLKVYQLEQRYQAETSAILRSLADVILVRDIEGRCLKVISGSTDKLYRPANEMVGKTLHESLPKAQADIILGHIQEAIESQKSVRGEYDLVVEGKLVNFSAVFSPIADNSAVVVTHDVTELKKIENQLSIHALITKNIAEGICLIRASDGTIVYTNPKFESMFGYDPCELIGENVAILNYSDSKVDGAATAEHLLDKIGQYGEFTYEVHNVKKDGQDFWCRATTSVLEHPELGSVYVAVQTDVTAEKRSKANIELLDSLTAEIDKIEDFESALSLVLRKVSEVHGWVYGEAWLLSSSEDALQCSPAYYSQPRENISDSDSNPLTKFRASSEPITFPIGADLPGRVYKSQRPEWQVDISAVDEDTFLRKSIALECGIKTGLGIPLVVNDRVIAVLTFFRENTDEADSHLMVNLSAIASQLSSKKSKRQVEKNLTETQALVQTALDFADGVVLVLDENNRIQYFNSAAQALIGHDPADIRNLLLSDVFTPIDEKTWMLTDRSNESGIPHGDSHPQVGTVLLDRLGNQTGSICAVTPVRSQSGRIISTMVGFQPIV